MYMLLTYNWEHFCLKNVYTECIDLCTLFENFVIDFIELCKFVEKICMLNVQNWVHSLKNYVR